MKRFEQGLVVKLVWQNIKSFSYLNLYQPKPASQLDRNLFSGLVFEMIGTYLTPEQPLEDGSWSVSAFILPNKFLRSLRSDIFSSRLFLVIYTLDRNRAQ